MLEEERQFYEEHLQEWLSHYAGKFALVKGRQLIGTFNTVEEALGEGTRRFGLTSFLVRQVQRVQPEVKVPALTLGLLNADSQHAALGAGTGTGR